MSSYDEEVHVEVPEPESQETTYQIMYYKNGRNEKKHIQTLDKYIETSLKLNQFTRGGYTLEGWYENAKCSGEKFENCTDNYEGLFGVVKKCDRRVEQ